MDFLPRTMYIFLVDFCPLFHYNALEMPDNPAKNVTQNGGVMAGRRGTVSFDTLRTRPTRTPRAWLAWVLQVANVDLLTLTSRQQRSLLVEVLEFLWSPSGPGIGGDPDHLELPSAAELRQIQEAFRRTLRAMADKSPAHPEAFHQ